MSISGSVSTDSFLRKWDVLKKCPDLLNHRITKFAILDQNAWLVNDQGRLLAFGKNKAGILGLGHSNPIEESLVEVEALREKKIVDLSFGTNFVVALTDDAQVWTWGTTNEKCVLGVQDRDEPIVPKLLCTDIASIKCGYGHNLVLSKSGKLWAWGWNNCLQIGNGSNDPSFELVSLTSLQTEVVTKIACGRFHSLALTEDGKLFAWGQNGSGKLGVGDYKDRSTPVQVSPFVDKLPIEDIACGYDHSLVLLENGHIYAMGDNNWGQLGCPDIKSSSLIPVKVESDIKFRSVFCCSNFSAAMACDGFVYVSGCLNRGVAKQFFKTPCTSFSEVLLFFYSSTGTPRNMLVDNIDLLNFVHNKLGALFNDPTTSDIVFLVEGKSIHAHRHHLKLMSSYLARMLSEHWHTESKQIEISHHNYPTFLAYIRYLYTGLVAIKFMNLDEIVDLLDLATSFIEESLRRECAEALQCRLCIEHACTIYQAADQYELSDLKNAAAKFIRNNIVAVVATDAYGKMSLESSRKLLSSMAGRS